MLQTTGTITLKDVHLETPSIKPISMKECLDYYNLTGKTGMDSFYGKEERLLKEVLVFKDQTTLNFQLANRRPQTPEMIFNSWGRIKGNIFYASKLEADAAGDAEATAWYFQNGQIYMPLNVEPINGFVSNMLFDNYSFECTLSSNNGDNDSIGLIGAFHRENGNNYYLCFYANMSGTLPYTGIGVSYQGAGATHTTWDNGSGLLYTGGEFGNTSASSGYGWSNRTRRLKIERNNDILKFWYSEIDSETLPIDPQFILDLTSDARLLKFRGKKKYGYMTNSQPYSTYKNIVFINNGMDENLIVDSTGKKVYRFNAETNTWDLTTETISEAIGHTTIILNPEGLDYNENYWYEVDSNGINYKGKYTNNGLPDATKIKTLKQFININELDYGLVDTASMTNTIAAFQRRNYFNMPAQTDIVLSSYSNREIVLDTINYKKLDITNLDRTSLVLSNNKLLASKYKSLNTLEIYNPKSWYLMNIDETATIATTTASYNISTSFTAGETFWEITFYNGKYYIGTGSGAYTSEDLQTWTKNPLTTGYVSRIESYKNYIAITQSSGNIVLSTDNGSTFTKTAYGSGNIISLLFTTENNIDYLYAGTQDGNIIKIKLSDKSQVFKTVITNAYIDDLAEFNGKILFGGYQAIGSITYAGVATKITLSTITNDQYARFSTIITTPSGVYTLIEGGGMYHSTDGTNWTNLNMNNQLGLDYIIYNSMRSEFMIAVNNDMKFIKTPLVDFSTLTKANIISTFALGGGSNEIKKIYWEAEYNRYLIVSLKGLFVNYIP